MQKLSNGLKDRWSGFTGLFANKKALNNQITDLERQIGELKIQNQSLAEYQGEALRLQKLLEFKNNNLETYTLQGARVIARSPDNWFKNLMIDKGSNSGIKPGMPVISPDGLVGRVAAVTQNSAQVDLITDTEMAIGAFLAKSREVTGIVEGQGNNTNLNMINIPDDKQIAPYDMVITAGLSSVYPKGIPIGTVIDIGRERGGLLFTANLKPAVDFSHLEEVLVIINYRPLPDVKQGTAG
ncbi:MAG TPA: rod shape-determining protein MreC [Syntrophomonadaceae bacterium]|nr:rod shape-determining protein MreC [Syntrophomonadaceae bacterium]